MCPGSAAPADDPSPEILREHFVDQIFGIVLVHFDSSRTTLLFLGDVLLRRIVAADKIGEHIERDGKCSSSTFALKQVISLAVNASSIPPTESTDCAISSAVRFSVPLKTMCSMKWAIPLRSGDSPREPVLSQIPRRHDRTCGIFSVTTTRPFGSSALSMSRTG